VQNNRRACTIIPAGGLAIALLFGSAPAHAQDYSIKSHETIELFSVYWISNCKSILKSFAGIDKLEGPDQISLSLKPGRVYAHRQRCAAPVNGATVMVKSGTLAQQTHSKLVFRVRYNTVDGLRQSTHTVMLDLYP
jgi:hypothetical protein